MQVPMSPVRFLNRSVLLYPNKPAIVCGPVTETYREFQDRVHQFSHALQQMGVQQGDRVAYLALNCHRMIEGYYAVPQIGAILLCMNIRLSPPEIVYILNDAQPKVLVLSQMMVPLWEQIADQCPSVQQVILQEGRVEGKDWPSFDELLAAQPTTAPEVPSIDENDVAELFYTSGTTGRPKGVMLTYRNLYTHAISAALTLNLDDTAVQVVGTVPLFHVNAWGSPHYLVMLGATQVVVPKFDPQLFCEAVQSSKATLGMMVPTMLNALLNYPERNRYDLSSLQQIVLGGAPCPYALIQEARETLGCTCMVGYGLSETAPIVSVAVIKSTLKDRPQEEIYRRQAMTGIPAIGIEVDIFGDDDRPLPHDGRSIGELAVRGDSVMKGYWNKPEETQAVFRNGWFFTGDVATMDEEGYISIVDRRKDIIISGGENISSVEVEDVIYQHPAVLEAAVIGVPDPKWGETPKALVALKPGASLTEEELIAFCKERLAHFKCPTSVEFVQELPKTGTGKIVKSDLRKKYWESGAAKVQ